MKHPNIVRAYTNIHRNKRKWCLHSTFAWRWQLAINANVQKWNNIKITQKSKNILAIGVDNDNLYSAAHIQQYSYMNTYYQILSYLQAQVTSTFIHLPVHVLYILCTECYIFIWTEMRLNATNPRIWFLLNAYIVWRTTLFFALIHFHVISIALKCFDSNN